MKILGLKTVLIGAVLLAVWAGLSAVGVANGQVPARAGQPAAKRPMTFADLMAMKRVSDPQISPSGKWVLFSVMDVSLEKNTKTTHLWVVPIDGSVPEKQVTFGDGETFGRFSPNGLSVSYTGAPTKDDPVSRIVVATWDEKTGTIFGANRLKVVSGDADGAIWSPDSQKLLYTAEVYPECSLKSDEWTIRDRWEGSAQTVSITWEEDACNKAKDDAAAANPVKAQVWDELLYRHWDQYMGQKRNHLIMESFAKIEIGGPHNAAYVWDLTPASAVGDAETPTWFLGAPLQYAWAPDSKEIAYVTNLDKVPAASTNNDVFTLRLDESGAKAVKVSTSPGSDDAPAYSPDGKWLAFRSQKQAGFESDRFRLMVVQRVSESAGQQVSGREWSEPKELMPKFDRWVDEFTWAGDSKAIYFTAGNQGGEPIFSVTLDGSIAKHTDVSAFSESRDQGEYGELTVSSDGQYLAATLMSVDSPSEVVFMKTKPHVPDVSDNFLTPAKLMFGSAAVTRFEQLDWRGGANPNRDLLEQLDLDSLEEFWFTGADGARVQGFVLRPPNFDQYKKYPVKFVMHGGPQTALGDSWSYRWNWELLAADGYVVVGINRRGSTGYGQKFVDEVSGDWGGRAYEDLMKGLDYAEAHYSFIDKTRECALGASYGGFMADWVLTHTNRFKCIVTHDGMFDPVSAYGTTEELWFNEWEFRRPEDFPKGWDGFSAGYDPMGHPNPPKQSLNGAPGSVEGHAAEPWRYQNLPADEDPFRKWSPMRFIENAKTPTLIIHSQRDYRLDVSQGFELYTALQRLNVPSKFLYFPDEGHWVLKPQNSQLWYQTVNDWCDRWTKTGKYAEK